MGLNRIKALNDKKSKLIKNNNNRRDNRTKSKK